MRHPPFIPLPTPTNYQPRCLRRVVLWKLHCNNSWIAAVCKCLRRRPPPFDEVFANAYGKSGKWIKLPLIRHGFYDRYIPLEPKNMKSESFKPSNIWVVIPKKTWGCGFPGYMLSLGFQTPSKGNKLDPKRSYPNDSFTSAGIWKTWIYTDTVHVQWKIPGCLGYVIWGLFHKWLILDPYWTTSR